MAILLAFFISADAATAKPTVSQTISYLEAANPAIADGSLQVSDRGVVYSYSKAFMGSGTTVWVWFPLDSKVFLEVKSTRCWDDGNCDTDKGTFMVAVSCTDGDNCTGFSQSSSGPVTQPNSGGRVFGILPNVTEARRVANAVAHLAALMGRSLTVIDRTADAIDGSAFD